MTSGIGFCVQAYVPADGDTMCRGEVATGIAGGDTTVIPDTGGRTDGGDSADRTAGCVLAG